MASQRALAVPGNRERWGVRNLGHCPCSRRALAAHAIEGRTGDSIDWIRTKERPTIAGKGHMDIRWTGGELAMDCSHQFPVEDGIELANVARILGDSWQSRIPVAPVDFWLAPWAWPSGVLFGPWNAGVLMDWNVTLFRWGLLTLSLSVVEQFAAQWLELDAELTDQVNSGWLSAQERLSILNHLERSGLPIDVCEAWAIDGLSHGAARTLMSCVEWQHLVNRANRDAGGKGPSVEARYAVGSGLHSVRFRNPGKWGVRFDRAEADVSGYVLAPLGPGGRWSALAGGHRLGWGNRTLVGEGMLFAGLDAPSFALPVQYGFAPMWGPTGQGGRRGFVLHRQGPVASTLSMDIRHGDVALGFDRNGRQGIFARIEDGTPSATLFAQGLWGNCHWVTEAGRLPDGWAWSGASQWIRLRHNEARLKLNAFYPDGGKVLQWEASTGGEWRVSRCIFRWLIEWGNRTEVHPLWVKVKKEWSGGHALEVHWRSAQSKGHDAKERERLEFRWQWKVNPSVIRFTLIPSADAQAPGAVSAFVSHQFKAWKLKQSFTVWTFDAGRGAYIPEPTWTGTTYRMIAASGHRWASVLQCKRPSGWTWLLAVSRSNRPADVEGNGNMLTLTSAQTEFNISMRMSL